MNQAQCTDWMTWRPVASGVSLMHLYNKVAPSNEIQEIEQYGSVTIAIMNALQGFPKSAAYIGELTGLETKQVRDRLKKLERRGRVEKASQKKPYIYKSLERVGSGDCGVSSSAGEGDVEDAQGGDSGPDDFVHSRQAVAKRLTIVAGL